MTCKDVLGWKLFISGHIRRRFGRESVYYADEDKILNYFLNFDKCDSVVLTID